MGSRITGVTAPADERQSNGEGERETLVRGRKNNNKTNQCNRMRTCSCTAGPNP